MEHVNGYPELYDLPKDQHQPENISITMNSAIISNYLLTLPC